MNLATQLLLLANAQSTQPSVDQNTKTDFFSNIEHYQQMIVDYTPRIIGVIILLLLAWIISGWLGNLITRATQKAKLEETLAIFFGRLVKWGVLIMAVLAGLSIFGIQTTSFAATLAAVGFAIGLAMQGTLSNFAAGVMLLIFRPFKVGDLIEVADEIGFVREIDLFSTFVDTWDNRRIIIPNGEIFGNKIENLSHNPIRRVDIPVGTEYEADLRLVRSVLETVPAKVEHAIKEPTPMVFLKELGDSSINWEVRVWCKPDDYWNVWEETVLAIKESLDEANLGIPFPQRDVHIDGAIGQYMVPNVGEGEKDSV